MNKRFPAGLLALYMVAGLMPGTAFAQEGQHTHNAGGWACTAVTEEALACAQPEHTHGEGCYDAAGALTCALAEHVHSGDCYTTAETWQCTPPAPEMPGDGQPAGDETPVNQQPGEGEDSAADETPEQDPAGPSVPETPVTEEAGDGEPPADTTAELPQTTPAASSTQPAREPSGEPSGDPAGQPAAQADDGVYQLTEETYDTVLQQAQDDEHQDIVLELTEDIAQNAAGETIRFTGIPDKAVTLRSAGDTVYSICLGSELQGALTLDTVTLRGSSTLYANGHAFATTANFTDHIGTLYGGGSEGNDVTGDVCIELRGGSVEELYGGGRDSNVNGNVYILVDIPIQPQTHSVSNLHGGGYAEETPNGKITGDVTIDMRQGMTGSFFGGGNNAYATTDAEGDRDPASIGGTVTVNLGYEGAPQNSVQPGMATYTHAGSQHSTVGNIVLNVTDGVTTESDGGDRNILGCGESDTVRGTVTIRIYGKPDILDSFIRCCGDTDYAHPDWPVYIKNEDGKELALHVVYDVSADKPGDEHGISVGSEEAVPTTIDGNVQIELKNGNMSFLVLDNENFGYCTINGNSEIRITNGRAAQVQGNQKEYKSEENQYTTTVTLDGPAQGADPIEIGYFYYFDVVNIAQNANVLEDSTKFAQFGGSPQKPFYSVDALNVKAGAHLTTQNGGQARVLSQVYLAGTWEQKYVSGNSVSDADRSAADLRVGNSMTVDGGTLISHGTAHIYNSLWADGGKLVFMRPSIIGMTSDSTSREFSVKGTEVYLPVIEGETFYPQEGLIPLAVGVKATGAADVYLFEGDDYTRIAQIDAENLGQNYINAQKEVSDAVFTLANDSAKQGGYYFKRVEDAKTYEATAYDMWQIAKMHVVTFDKNNADAGATEADPQTMFVEEQVQGPSCLAALPAAPVRSGYVFLGWNTAADGSGAAFDTAYDVTGDLTVYAQWKKQEDTPQPPADPGGSNAGTSDNGGSQPQAAPQQPAPRPAAAEAAAPAASAAPAAAIPQTGDELPAGALGGAAVAAAGALLALLALRKRRAQ